MPYVAVVPASKVEIFIGGDYAQAVHTSLKFCDEVGLCVTVTPTTYVYTGGYEAGVIVGLINYGRFPGTHHQLVMKAKELAERLRIDLNQESYTVQDAVCQGEATPISRWTSYRKADNVGKSNRSGTRESGDRIAANGSSTLPA